MAMNSNKSTSLETGQLKVVNLGLQNGLQIKRFGVQCYCSDNKLIKYYTGFSAYSTLTAFFYRMLSMARTMQAVYCIAAQEHKSHSLYEKVSCSWKMNFMFLCLLWSGLQEHQHLAVQRTTQHFTINI